MNTEQPKKNSTLKSSEMQRAETNRKEEFEKLKKQLRDDNIKIYDEDDELILPRPNQTDKNAPIKARAFQSYKVNQHQVESFEIRLPRTCMFYQTASSASAGSHRTEPSPAANSAKSLR